MKKTLVVLAIVALFAAGSVLGSAALADDLNPPSYRGAQLSYYAEWDVFANGNFEHGSLYVDAESWVGDDIFPNDLSNGIFDFGSHLTHFDSGAWALVPTPGGSVGLLAVESPVASGNLFTAVVRNWIDWQPEKHLRVQVAYIDDLGNGPPVIYEVEGMSSGPEGGGGSGDGPFPSTVVGGAAQPGYFYEDWTFTPTPDWEVLRFDVPVGTIIDQIVIDTVSPGEQMWRLIPEPGSFAVLALGFAGMIGRKRRK